MTRIILRNDTAARWTQFNPILAKGELGVETDTRQFKFGNGTTTWTALPYAGGGSELDQYLEINASDNMVTLTPSGGKALVIDAPAVAVGENLVNEINGANTQLYLKQGDFETEGPIEITPTATGVKVKVTAEGGVTQADLDKKQDKLTTKAPIKIDVAPDDRLVGFEVDTLTNQMRATNNQVQTMSFGYGQTNSINVANVQAYIKIPYTLGQVLRLPFKPTQTYSTAYYSLQTAMLPGWYGHTNEDGTVSPVLTACMRSKESTGGSYDTAYSYYFYNFGDSVDGKYTSNSEGSGAHFPGTVAGDAGTPVLYTAVTFDSNTNKLVLDMQFPSNGYKNPDYSAYWTAGCDHTPPTNYQGIDCFIYCPPGQEYINQNLFGLFNSEGRLGPGMLEFTKTAGNLFSFEGADIQYLQLDIGDGLSVVNGKLTASGSIPSNMVTTDTEQIITGRKHFDGINLRKGGHIILQTTAGSDHADMGPWDYQDGNGTAFALACRTGPVHMESSIYKYLVNTAAGVTEELLTKSKLPVATDMQEGIVQVDGTTIVANDGVISAVGGGLSGTDRYGIRGDYATRYGILDCPNGIIEYNATGKEIRLKQGVVLQCAGQDMKTTVSGDIITTLTSTGEIVLFYAGGELLECGKVDYQEETPTDDGVDNYQAWFKPSEQAWYLKSNDTGNVFRSISGTPIANIKLNDSNITRVDYIGYRILDDDILVDQTQIDSINDSIETLTTNVNELGENVGNAVTLTGNQTIAGEKTFSSGIMIGGTYNGISALANGDPFGGGSIESFTTKYITFNAASGTETDPPRVVLGSSSIDIELAGKIYTANNPDIITRTGLNQGVAGTFSSKGLYLNVFTLPNQPASYNYSGEMMVDAQDGLLIKSKGLYGTLNNSYTLMLKPGTGAFMRRYNETGQASDEELLDTSNAFKQVKLTQAEYDALTPDENTMYIIVG